MKKSSLRGFTLIEIMVVVGIVAILIAIAVPSYSRYVLKSRRLDGQSNLLKIQTRLEEYFVQNESYPVNTTNFPIPSSTYYQYSYVPSGGNTAYTITATALGNQANDQEGSTSCNSLSVDSQNNKTPTACWPSP